MEALFHKPVTHNFKVSQTTGRPLFNGKNPDVVLSKLEYALAIGCTVEEACSLAMISPAAYYRFIEKNPEFRERFEGLKHITIFNARKAIADELQRGNWKLAWKFLEAKCPQEFSSQWVLRKQNDQLRTKIRELEEYIEALVTT